MSKALTKTVSLSLTPEVIAILDRVASATGSSRSSCANDLILSMGPTLIQTATQIEELAQLSQAQRKEIEDQFAALEKQATQHQGESAAMTKALTSLIHSAKFKNL